MEPMLTRAQARAIERGDGNVDGNEGIVTGDRKRKIKDPDLMERHKDKTYRKSSSANPPNFIKRKQGKLLPRTLKSPNPKNEIVLPQHVSEMDSSMPILLEVRSDISHSKIEDYDTALGTIIGIQSTAICKNFLSYHPEARKYIPIMEHHEEIAKQKLESEKTISKLKAEVTELEIKVDEIAKENLELEKKSIDYAADRDYWKGRVAELERQPIKVLDSQSDALDCPMLELLAEESNPEEVLEIRMSQLQELRPPTSLSTNLGDDCSRNEEEMPNNEDMDVDDDIASSTRASGIHLSVTWSSISPDSQETVKSTLQGHKLNDEKITEKLEGPILFELMNGRMPPEKDFFESIIQSQFSKYETAYGEGGFSSIELVDIHVKLALENIFPWSSQNWASANNLNSSWKEEIVKVGMVEVKTSGKQEEEEENSIEKEDLKFIGDGFAEYLVARWLAKLLHTQGGWNKELSIFFIKDALALDINFEYLYDSDGQNDDDWDNSDQELKCYTFLQDRLCSLLNSIVGERKEDIMGHLIDFTEVCDEADITAIGRACVHDEFSHLFQLILNVGTFNGCEVSHLLFAKSVIFAAASKPSLEFFKFAKSSFKSDCWMNVDLKVKGIKKAAQRGDLPMVEFLLNEMGVSEIVKELNEKLTDLIHCFTEDSLYDSDEELIEKRKILQLLNSVNPSLKSIRREAQSMLRVGGPPLLGCKVHLSLLTELLELGADVHAVDNHGYAVLHHNADSSEVFESLLNIIPDKDLKELVHVRGVCGDTPLMSVVRKDTLTRQILEKLLAAEADINVVDSEGYSVIAAAIKEGKSATLVNLLMDLGADVAWRGRNKETVFHIAVDHGRSELVSVFLKNKIDPNCEDAYGRTPLDYLFSNEKMSSHCDSTLTETAILLQSAGGKLKVKVNNVGQTLLHREVIIGTCYVVKLLVELGLNVNQGDIHGNTPLHVVVDHCQRDQTEKIKCLLLNKANPDAMNVNGETPLHIGLKNRSLSLENFQLLKSRTNMSSTKAFIVLQLEFLFCTVFSTEGLRDMLVSLKGLDQKHYFQYKNKRGHSLLHFATICGNKAAVKFLLLEGMDVNVRNTRLQTSLHVAVKNFDSNDRNPRLQSCGGVMIPSNIEKIPRRILNFGMAKCLIENGADPGLKDAKGYTFLHRYIRVSKNTSLWQFNNLVEYLLSRDSLSLFNIHGGPDGSTPLQEAVQLLNLKTETITSLISHGVDINAVDNHGDSVLSYAIRGKKDEKFLTNLVEMGLDWKHLNFKGKNLLYFATQACNWKAVDLLLKNGVVWRKKDLKRARKFGWKHCQ